MARLDRSARSSSVPRAAGRASCAFGPLRTDAGVLRSGSEFSRVTLSLACRMNQTGRLPNRRRKSPGV